jgi:copper(I)-binding protein
VPSTKPIRKPITKRFEKPSGNSPSSGRAATRLGLAVCGLFAATAIAGCGAGQISQVATQEPAVNGTGGTVNNVTLRNVHLQVVQTSDAVPPGTDVDLIFTATNQSPDTDDRLLRITSDVGTVTLTGDTVLPANGLLEVGVPDGVEELASLPEAANGAEATVALSEPIRNGLTYPFTFTFENAGDKTLDVPISAGNAPRQGSESSSGGGHGSGH